jgi:hypothetical protein
MKGATHRPASVSLMALYATVVVCDIGGTLRHRQPCDEPRPKLHEAHLDWLTFISTDIKSIAWPTVVVIALVVLRGDVAALLGKLGSRLQKN